MTNLGLIEDGARCERRCGVFTSAAVMRLQSSVSAAAERPESFIPIYSSVTP
jgi:hypothetical protein